MTNTAAKLPWEKHPDLTQERLSEIASLLARVREDALEDHDPDKGDSPWGFGCRALERSIDAIVRFAAKNSWVHIIESGSKRIVFSVGAVPFRFYKGRANKPKANTLAVHSPELDQTRVAYPDDAGREWVWRFAVETDASGAVLRIVVAEIDRCNGHVRDPWDVPFRRVAPLAVVTPFIRPAAKLAPPKVTSKKKAAEERAKKEQEQKEKEEMTRKEGTTDQKDNGEEGDK